MKPCGCRDCPDISAGSFGTPTPLCWECVDADCVPFSELDRAAGVPSYVYDCQRAVEEHSESPYAPCGCIAPCPDHNSPKQDAKIDREYWNG